MALRIFNLSKVLFLSLLLTCFLVLTACSGSNGTSDNTSSSSETTASEESESASVSQSASGESESQSESGTSDSANTTYTGSYSTPTSDKEYYKKLDAATSYTFYDLSNWIGPESPISNEKLDTSSGSSSVSGTFTNNTDETLYYVDVNVQVYGETGPLGTPVLMQIKAELKPGDSWNFEGLSIAHADIASYMKIESISISK